MTSQNPKQTEKAAAHIYTNYLHKYPSVLLLLEGELGVGKTYFIQSLGKYLGISETINSPSFNLLNIYSGETYDLYHYDLYRLHDAVELEHLDFVERWSSQPDANRKYIHAIEWPQIAQDYLPKHLPVYRFVIEWEDIRRVEERRKLQLYGESAPKQTLHATHPYDKK